MDPCISLLCGACAAVGRALPSSHCSARLSLLFSAYAAVGCALECKDCVALLRLSHQNSQELLLLLCGAHAHVGCALPSSHPVLLVVVVLVVSVGDVIVRVSDSAVFMLLWFAALVDLPEACVFAVVVVVVAQVFL